MTTKTPSIRVVTVCFGSLSTLHEWYRLRGSEEVRVVLIDNGHERGLPAYASSINAEMQRPSHNLGFGRGCNLGLDLSGSEEWIAFVNPDVSVTSDDLMALAAGAQEDCVATSPVLIDSSGSPQPDMYRKLPNVLSMVSPWVAGRRGNLVNKNVPSLTELELTSGSCLMVRRECMERIGGFPTWLFFNYEDIYVMRELGALGRIQVQQNVRVPHMKFASETVVPRASLLAESARSAAAYAMKVHGTLGWLAVSLASCLGLLLRVWRRPGGVAMVVKLARTQVGEGGRIRRGVQFSADPTFVSTRA